MTGSRASQRRVARETVERRGVKGVSSARERQGRVRLNGRLAEQSSQELQQPSPRFGVHRRKLDPHASSRFGVADHRRRSHLASGHLKIYPDHLAYGRRTVCINEEPSEAQSCNARKGP